MTQFDVDLCFVAPHAYEYLDPDSTEPAGGAQRQQYMLARELRDRGYSIAFIVEDVGQPAEQLIDDMWILPGCPLTVSSPVAIPGILSQLWRTMYRINADRYYIRGAPRLAIATGLGSRLLGAQFIFCVANDADIVRKHLEDRYGPVIRQVYLRTVRGADTVITQTQRQQTYLKSEYGIDSTQIHNGYHIPDKTAVQSADTREFVLWVGSSDPSQKRPGIFLDLAQQLPELEFVMISKPMSNDEQSHYKLTSQATDVSNLQFLGGVDPDVVHDYYRRAQLLVNTSSHEGFPNTFLEAWRFATPIVSLSFDLDGILETNTGGVYANGSFDRLCAVVRALVADTDRRRLLGNSGRELLIEQYSLDNAATQYESLLNNSTG